MLEIRAICGHRPATIGISMKGSLLFEDGVTIHFHTAKVDGERRNSFFYGVGSVWLDRIRDRGH